MGGERRHNYIQAKPLPGKQLTKAQQMRLRLADGNAKQNKDMRLSKENLHNFGGPSQQAPPM